MDHKAESIVITCIDFRLQEAINNWIAQNFKPGTFDRVALAGGVKSLDTIMDQIDIAVGLHHIKKVVLVNHEDCGTYGETNTPQKHAEDLRSAGTKIKAHYPDLGVETYYLHLDGTFEPIS